MKTYTIRNQNGQIKQVTEDQLADYGLEIPKAKKGGMIKRADGSYSRRGLWDNIRANKGSGKKPTKAMLAQERKIRAAEKAYGGYMQMGGITDTEMAYGGMYAMGGYLPMAEEGMGNYNWDYSTLSEVAQPAYTDPTQISFTKEAPVKKSTGPSKYSIVDYLSSTGRKSDKESRKQLAKELGIKDYDFSAAKNTELLAAIQQRDSKKAPKGSKVNPINLPEVEITGYRAAAPKGTKANPIIAPEVAITPQPAALQSFGNYMQNYWRNQQSPYLNTTPVPTSPFLNIQGLNPALSGFNPKYPNFIQGKENGGGIDNPGFRALPDYVQEKIKANMATGGCMSCGGRMQEGGTPFENYLQKYPSRPATDTLVGTPFYGDTPASEQLRVNDLLKARQQTPNLQNRWGAEEKMNPSIYDWDPTLYPNITPANKPFKPVMQEGGYLDEAGDGKWIQKATASIKRRGTEGVCTGSKFGSSSCPPGSKRYNLAKTFRKMAKSRKKEDGGYAEGGQYEMSDAQIAKLRAMGYKIKEV